MDRQELAETLALRALAWVLAEEAPRAQFLAATGVMPRDLTRLAQDAAGLAAVLDFVLAEDGRVLACAAALGVAPHEVAAARTALPGDPAPHWT